MAAKVLEELGKFGISCCNIHCSLFDNAEAATGREIQKITGCGVQACVLHSLSKGIQYSCGKETYKAEDERMQKLNNPHGTKLLKASTDQAKVFQKSWPKKKKLQNIQRERI